MATMTNKYAGVVFDTLKFDMGLKARQFLIQKIKLRHGPPVFGPAFTCQGQYGSDTSNDHIRIEMLEHMYPGCIQVIATGGATDVAVYGDISARLAANFGAFGCVIGGKTRDIDLMPENFAIACTGLSPVDAYGVWHIKDYQTPVFIHTIEINPGDYVFADQHGTMVVPRNRLGEFNRHVAERMGSEAALRKLLIHNISFERIKDLYERSTRW